MEARLATRIEAVADIAAAIVLALAIAAAGLRFGFSPVNVALAAAAGALVSWKILASIQAEPPALALAFEPGSLPEAEGPDELILTDADRYEPPVECDDCHDPEPEEELVLDDVLAHIDEGSRVVRLFDPAAMPTPGQLRSRIERHLAAATLTDASRELHDALAELRRTLR